MRTITINSAKILKQLQEKDTLSKRLVEIDKECQEKEAEAKKIYAKLSRIDERVRPEIKREYSKLVIGEYEQLSRVFLKDDSVNLEIADRLEEFKEMFKKSSQ